MPVCSPPKKFLFLVTVQKFGRPEDIPFQKSLASFRHGLRKKTGNRARNHKLVGGREGGRDVAGHR